MLELQSGAKRDLTTTMIEIDLKVAISQDLKPEKQINKAALIANKFLGLLKNTFISQDPALWKKLYTTYQTLYHIGQIGAVGQIVVSPEVVELRIEQGCQTLYHIGQIGAVGQIVVSLVVVELRLERGYVMVHWSDWGTWSNCTVTCGIGIMNRTRMRFSIIDICVGNTTDKIDCYSNQTCTDWGSWSNCTVTCGVGIMNRARMCLGTFDLCGGNTTDIAECFNNQSCTANTISYWSDWSIWSNCSVSCGGGTKSRTRICLDPFKSCVGNTTDITDCYSNLTCADLPDILTSKMALFAGDTTIYSCHDKKPTLSDHLERAFEFEQDLTSATAWGSQWLVNLNKIQHFSANFYHNILDLPIFINANSMLSWSDWGNWSNCTVTCGIGFMNRTRMCLGLIDVCVGNTTDITNCSSNQTCTANPRSYWSDWSSWLNCSVSCGGGTKNRTRTCLDPVKSCVGNTIAISKSSWSDWGSWSNFSVSFGVGIMNRTRICFGTVDLCFKKKTTTITDCYKNLTCTANPITYWSDWSIWSYCSVSCGSGTMNRTRMCLVTVESCVGNTTDVTDCYSNQTCAANSISNWSDWSSWSDCNVSCGNGTKNRTKTCLDTVKSCVGNITDISDCYSNLTCAD
ncbi:A disintegrin and metalloproteinase with thrombospondin motifs adt-1-like [Hydra vulgaris]|uniref:A disintegrin and metalloproteinase with thrombospondin motifs adt-1-like n=1 Tax=Hydra vulgaris TaxID=6087 RepID=A0ABM4DF57_HYDVU